VWLYRFAVLFDKPDELPLVKRDLRLREALSKDAHFRAAGLIPVLG
jgi:hypothetical protein